MFEKESVEYLKKEGAKSAQIFSTMLEEAPLQITSKQIPYIFATVAQAFQDGAEYGYNKANEWHFVKDGDLPKDNRYVLIVTRTDVYRGFYENNNWYGDEGGRLRCIAWKELPELPKEIE